MLEPQGFAVSQPLNVQVIAASQFFPPGDIDWSPEAGVSDSESLIEFAGRACYETFDRPNPHTQANSAYIRHILEVGHTALLEHANATLYIRGLSRGAAHELLRHRHFSFSQLSQRYLDSTATSVTLPPMITNDEALTARAMRAIEEARVAYDELLDALEDRIPSGANALLSQKQARQAARAVLPNATETRIVVTGNYRAWRHFIGMRASEHADIEIRHLAVTCLRLLQEQAPVVFSDFEIQQLTDGSEMAASAYVSEL